VYRDPPIERDKTDIPDYKLRALLLNRNSKVILSEEDVRVTQDKNSCATCAIFQPHQNYDVSHETVHWNSKLVR
jgi:hypothetical protein